MPGPISLDTDRRRKSGAGEECKFKAYTNPLSLSETNEYTGFSRCGFNKDSSGYCDIRRGDKEFTSAYENYQKLFDSNLTNCHLMGTLDKCTSENGNSLNTNLLWNQAQFYVNQGNFASIADNDKCVKSSITNIYWQQGFSSFLGNIGYITLSLSLAYTILMMT